MYDIWDFDEAVYICDGGMCSVQFANMDEIQVLKWHIIGEFGRNGSYTRDKYQVVGGLCC